MIQQKQKSIIAPLPDDQKVMDTECDSVVNESNHSEEVQVLLPADIDNDVEVCERSNSVVCESEVLDVGMKVEDPNTIEEKANELMAKSEVCSVPAPVTTSTNDSNVLNWKKRYGSIVWVHDKLWYTAVTCILCDSNSIII